MRARSLRSWVTSCVVVLAGALALATPAGAGTFPNLLDRNSGWSIPAPRIHNIYWDSGWNAHHPAALSTGTLNAFTIALTNNGYLNPAGQYGVGAATFGGSGTSNSACGFATAPSTISEVGIAAWLLCELNNPFSNVPTPSPPTNGSPVSNDMYVIYVPASATITGIFTVGAFNLFGHNFGPFSFGPPFCSAGSLVGGDHWILPVPTFLNGLVPTQVAFVPMSCANGQAGAAATRAITLISSHEIAEAVTDGIPGQGFIDNTFGSSKFSLGETGDLCEPGGGLTKHPQTPVLPAGSTASREVLGNFTFSTYWSNARGACVAGPLVGSFRVLRPITQTQVGATTTIGFTWLTPHRWRDLRTITLELRDGRRARAAVRFTNDGSATGQLAFGGQTGTPGQHRVLGSGPVSLVLGSSRVVGSGATGKTVAITIALRFGRKLARHALSVQIGATDNQGTQEPFRPAGAIAIR